MCYQLKIILVFLYWCDAAYLRDKVVKIDNRNLTGIPTTYPKDIEGLIINNSTLTSLENISFYDRLQSIIFINCKIHMMTETFYVINKIKTLQSLTFNRCSLQSFDLNRLKRNRNLKYLNLNNNPGILIFGSGMGSNLTELNLANNNLTRLPDGLKYLPCLEELNIDGNLIETITDDFADALKNLKKINVNLTNLKNTSTTIMSIIKDKIQKSIITEKPNKVDKIFSFLEILNIYIPIAVIIVSVIWFLYKKFIWKER